MTKEVERDGGWGWMVVLGAALINMVNQAMFSVFGLVFGEELKAMANGKAIGITLVMAVSVMVTNFSGLAVGPLMRKFNVRTITFVGIFCTGTGMIISSFATRIFHIIIGYGCFTGLGLGLLASCTFLAINQYFTKRKSSAVGLAMAGTSIGQMIMPIFIGILLKKYQYKYTAFILGLVNYVGLIGALFFEPMFCCKPKQEEDAESTASASELNVNLMKEIETDIKVEEETDIIDKIRDLNEKIDENCILNNKKQDASQAAGAADLLESNDDEKLEYKFKKKKYDSDAASLNHRRNCFSKIIHSLDLTLLTDLTFVHILLGLALGYTSSVTFSAFFPMLLQDELGFDMMQTTYCMTALSFADILGRTTISEICRRFNMNSKESFMAGALLLGICRSCMVELSSFNSVIIASLFVGYFRAATVINQNLVISEYISNDKLPAAVGLNMVAKGIFVITFGQSLGLLKDAFSYKICIHILDVILYLVVISWSIETIISRKLYKILIYSTNSKDKLDS